MIKNSESGSDNSARQIAKDAPTTISLREHVKCVAADRLAKSQTSHLDELNQMREESNQHTQETFGANETKCSSYKRAMEAKSSRNKQSRRWFTVNSVTLLAGK